MEQGRRAGGGGGSGLAGNRIQQAGEGGASDMGLSPRWQQSFSVLKAYVRTTGQVQKPASSWWDSATRRGFSRASMCCGNLEAACVPGHWGFWKAKIQVVLLLNTCEQNNSFREKELQLRFRPESAWRVACPQATVEDVCIPRSIVGNDNTDYT